MDHLPHLADLDLKLRRVRGDDQHVRVGLDEDAGLALVGLAQCFAGFHGCGHQGFKVRCVGDARAVGADAAEVGQPVGFGRVEAVERLRQHERQRVFTSAFGALAEVRDGLRVAEKILEAHGLSLVHSGLSCWVRYEPVRN